MISISLGIPHEREASQLYALEGEDLSVGPDDGIFAQFLLLETAESRPRSCEYIF